MSREVSLGTKGQTLVSKIGRDTVNKGVAKANSKEKKSVAPLEISMHVFDMKIVPISELKRSLIYLRGKNLFWFQTFSLSLSFRNAPRPAVFPPPITF